MNYDHLINFRWGSEPQGNITRNGLSKKWMFIKPDIGNLAPSPQVPFSSFNVIPYFGGYPTGFSIYEYCAWSTPKKCLNDKLMGFTHFSFSGSGNLHHFHNYFLIKPSKENMTITSEKFSLSGFEITTPIYKIKTIVNDRSAYYKINSKENVVIIPGFNGLTTNEFKSNIGKVEINRISKNLVNIVADYSVIKLYWCITIIKGKCIESNDKEIYLSKDVEFILSFSLTSIEDANEVISLFDKKQAINKWEECFNVFKIKDNSDYKKLFFTSLMFALKKPYIYNEKKIYDFATMWDIYRTLLPLIFLFYKKEASIIVNNMLELVNQDGIFYHTNLLSFDPALSDQAICLINISLSTAYLYEVEFDVEKAKLLQKREIEYYLNHLDKLDRTTHILDLCDAIVAYCYAYRTDLGLDKVKELFNKIFDKNKVYLDKNSTYYEGNYTNYSFRTSASTIYRLENKDKIIKALDRFFGFEGEDTMRFTMPTHPNVVKEYMATCKRFEGLNNEPDMETMYLYSYLGLINKQNEVIKDVINNSFSLKNNGVPGNDDNGALSSWLAFNLLGIYPIVGTDKIKIGLPFFKEVKAGNLLIRKHSKNDNCLDVEKVLLNNKPVNNLEITARDVNNGGILDIYLK